MYWIVVAESARARIFSRRKRYSPLEEVEDRVHPESRLHRDELIADRPGQVQESATPGENANEEPTDPKTAEARAFARELAEHLRSARVAGDFDRLMIAADPRFLGELRKRMDADTRECVEVTVDKNLTRHGPEKIERQLDAQ